MYGHPRRHFDESSRLSRATHGRRIVRTVLDVLLLLFICAFCAGVAAASAPFVRLFRAQGQLQKTNAMLQSRQYAPALFTLNQLEPRVSFYLPLLQDVRTQIIRCHLGLGRLDIAEQRAKSMLLSPPEPLQRQPPPGHLDAFWPFAGATADWFCSRVLTSLGAGQTGWAGWSGYQTIVAELDATGQRDLLMSLSERIESQYPDNPIVVRIGRPAPDQRPAPDALAAAEPQPSPAHEPAVATKPTPSPAPIPVVASSPAAVPVPAASAPPAPAPKPDTPVRNWGIVCTSDVYASNQRGERRIHLAPGTLVDIAAIRTLWSNTWAQCSFDDGGITIGGMLIPLDDLEVRDGPLGNARPREKELRVQRIKIARELAALRARGNGEGAPDVPAGPARQKFDAFCREVDAAKARMERATGAERMKLIDQLHKMKFEEVRLESAMKAETARSAVAAPAGAAAPGSRMAQLEAQLAATDRDLEAFR